VINDKEDKIRGEGKKIKGLKTQQNRNILTFIMPPEKKSTMFIITSINGFKNNNNYVFAHSIMPLSPQGGPFLILKAGLITLSKTFHDKVADAKST
jgi:hypothetical protein